MLAAATFFSQDAPPMLLAGLVMFAWAMPLPAAVAGWWVLRDLPRARRRYRSSAIAVLCAYAAVIASGAVVALTVGRDGPALGIGSCCLTVAGPMVALALLIQPSILRAGNGDVGDPGRPTGPAPATTSTPGDPGPPPDRTLNS